MLGKTIFQKRVVFLIPYEEKKYDLRAFFVTFIIFTCSFEKSVKIAIAGLVVLATAAADKIFVV